MWRLACEADDKNQRFAGQVPCRCESAPAKGWTSPREADVEMRNECCRGCTPTKPCRYVAEQPIVVFVVPTIVVIEHDRQENHCAKDECQRHEPGWTVLEQKQARPRLENLRVWLRRPAVPYVRRASPRTRLNTRSAQGTSVG